MGTMEIDHGTVSNERPSTIERHFVVFIVNDECDSGTHSTKILFDEDISPPTIMTVDNDNDSGTDPRLKCSVFAVVQSRSLPIAPSRR